MQVFFTGINQNGFTRAIVDMLRKKLQNEILNLALESFLKCFYFSSVRTDVQWGHLTA